MQRTSLPPPPPSLPQNPNSSASPPNAMYQYQQPGTSYAYPTYYSPHYAQAYYQPAVVQSTGQHNNSFASTGTSSYLRVGKSKKKKDGWDADPSLKGKAIPILGTNIVLDTPEVIDAWIAERKKRFPTAAYVEDKKRKREEAIARGQLDMTNTGGRQNKRQKIDNNHNHNPRNAAHGNNGRNAFQGRRHGQFSGNHGTQESGARSRVPDAGWPRNGKTKAKGSAPSTSKRAPSPSPSYPSDSDRSGEDDDCSDEPEIFSSKASLPAISSQAKEESPKPDGGSEPLPAQPQKNKDLVRPKKTLPLQPRQAPHNPFASRPSLLRNLLLPEIRATISNLSQAIRFLVDNDFLREVELKPAQFG
ncbi:hypothetical protein NLJ89_g2418 [Agrocybe chaxingu]|uniref:FMR1-interacting protein 1 conserved domain-containing protein n=1 Tax=Agrocybe chaxingu TaxID=84603 RepID=A0A9W8KCA6_9AGAR|nr:hypothetical protein NLJ89_g2418 [Agrocybe chaxingu]